MKARRRRSHVQTAAWVVAFVGALVGLAAAEGAAAAPRVVVTTPHPIQELAVGRDYVVWRSTWEHFGKDFGFFVRAELIAQHLVTRERETIRHVSRDPSWGWYRDIGLLGLARGRVLWQSIIYDRFGVDESWIDVFRLSDGRGFFIDSTYNDIWILDADRAPLLVGENWGDLLNPVECLNDWDEPTATCRWVAGGEVVRMDGSEPHTLDELPPPVALSGSRVRIALVPADPQEITGYSWHAVPLPVVELHRLEDGAVLRTIPVTGTPRAIALTPRVLGVLVQEGDALRIDRFRHDGTLLGSTALPGRTAWRLESDRGWFVTRSRGRILAIDAVTGELTTLAALRMPPLELQVRAGRVFWAANGRGHGRVLSLPLPTG